MNVSVDVLLILVVLKSEVVLCGRVGDVWKGCHALV